jgi:hypothetical protein
VVVHVCTSGVLSLLLILLVLLMRMDDASVVVLVLVVVRPVLELAERTSGVVI